MLQMMIYVWWFTTVFLSNFLYVFPPDVNWLMLAFRLNRSWRICMASIRESNWKIKPDICEPQESDMFYNVFAGAVSLLCYICIKAISWSSTLAKRLSVFSFAQLLPSDKYFSSNTQILFIFFPFESILLRTVTKMLGSAVRWNFWILLQRSDECAWVVSTFIFCLSFLGRLKTTGMECCFPSFCMILSSLRSLISFEAT